MASAKTTACFIPPMLLLRRERLPEGPEWLYELKLDGYRALAIKTGGKVHLRSRNDNDFNERHPRIVKALANLPDETVIDGEIVALDEGGRPSFNSLQNYASAGAPLLFFIFDVLILKGTDVMSDPLVKRRELIEEHVLPMLAEPIRYSPILDAPLRALIRSVKTQGLEGLVAKRRDKYEPGQRSGAWQKMRVNQGQELVIGGYTPDGSDWRQITKPPTLQCSGRQIRSVLGTAAGSVDLRRGVGLSSCWCSKAVSVIWRKWSGLNVRFVSHASQMVTALCPP